MQWAGWPVTPRHGPGPETGRLARVLLGGFTQEGSPEGVPVLSAVSRRHGIFPNHHVSSDSASHPETPSGGAQADCLPGRPFICLSPRPLKKAAFAPDYGQLWGKPPAPASEVPPLLSAIQGCLTFQAGGAFLTQRRSPGSQGTCGCPWLCSGLPYLTPRDLPDPGIEKPMSPVLTGRFFTTEAPGKHIKCTSL